MYVCVFTRCLVFIKVLKRAFGFIEQEKVKTSVMEGNKMDLQLRMDLSH